MAKKTHHSFCKWQYLGPSDASVCFNDVSTNKHFCPEHQKWIDAMSQPFRNGKKTTYRSHVHANENTIQGV